MLDDVVSLVVQATLESWRYLRSPCMELMNELHVLSTLPTTFSSKECWNPVRLSFARMWRGMCMQHDATCVAVCILSPSISEDVIIHLMDEWCGAPTMRVHPILCQVWDFLCSHKEVYVHSNELINFIPSFVLRVIFFTFINIFYAQPLVCGNQLHFEELYFLSFCFNKNSKDSMVAKWNLG